MTGKQFREAVAGRVYMKEVEKEVEDEEGNKEKKTVKEVVCDIGNMHVFRKVKDKLKVMARSQPDDKFMLCLLYTSPSPRDQRGSRMPSSA